MSLKIFSNFAISIKPIIFGSMKTYDAYGRKECWRHNLCSGNSTVIVIQKIMDTLWSEQLKNIHLSGPMMLVTLDAKDVFNSMSLNVILVLQSRFDISSYLVQIIRRRFSDGSRNSRFGLLKYIIWHTVYWDDAKCLLSFGYTDRAEDAQRRLNWLNGWPWITISFAQD